MTYKQKVLLSQKCLKIIELNKKEIITKAKFIIYNGSVVGIIVGFNEIISD